MKINNKIKKWPAGRKAATQNIFDGAVDNSWYFPNHFYNWLPSVQMSGTDPHTVDISLLQLDKHDVALSYQDSKLIIQSKPGSGKREQKDLPDLVFKRLFQLTAPAAIDHIVFKFKNGTREITLLDGKCPAAFDKIEINIPWSCLTEIPLKLN